MSLKTRENMHCCDSNGGQTFASLVGDQSGTAEYKIKKTHHFLKRRNDINHITPTDITFELRL